MPAKPAPQWDAAFARTDGWTGGDGIYSARLPGDRVLWLFSDSWVGPVVDGRHASGSRLVNNALAWHAHSVAGAAPAAGSVQFLWGQQPTDDGHPRAWIEPDPDRIPGAVPQGDDKTRTWYWLGDGHLTAGGNESPRLAICLWHIGRTPNDRGVFNFKTLGGAIAMVANPEAPPQDWRVEQFANPHAVKNEKFEVQWGSVAVAAPAEGGDAEFLYVYGYRDRPMSARTAVLARVPAARPEAFDQWRFYDGQGWTQDLEDAADVVVNVPTEFSVDRLEIDGRNEWLMIHSEPFFGGRIFARRAPAPEGPWSAPQPLYRVPELARSKNYFTYAAKAHPWLSPPGELLISYVVNSFDFGEMVRDASIYTPRFVRIQLSDLQAPAPRPAE